MRFESRGPSEDSTPRIRQRSELTGKADKQRTGTMQSKCECYQPRPRIITLTPGPRLFGISQKHYLIIVYYHYH